MYIKCARTGKSFPDSNAAKACEDKYCHAGLPCPFERIEENVESDEPVVPEVFQKVIDETTSRNKERGGFCAVIFGVMLISLGVSLFLGIRDYWYIMPLSIGFVIVIRSLLKKRKTTKE